MYQSHGNEETIFCGAVEELHCLRHMMSHAFQNAHITLDDTAQLTRLRIWLRPLGFK